jgi:hypothetical protein
MISIEHIQKLLFVFEQEKKLVSIKTQEYDILLEPIADINLPNIGANRCLLTLRVNKSLDHYYILTKINNYKYSNYQLSFSNNLLQISYIIDMNSLTNDIIINNIMLMETLL